MMKTKQTKQKRDKDQDRIEIRQKKVFRLHLQGVSIATIAESLNITTRTVDRDLQAFRNRRAKWLEAQIKKFDVTAYWAKRIEALEHLIEVNYGHLAESDAKDRVRLSSEIREIYKELDLLYRSAGIKTSLVDPEDLASETIQFVFAGEKGKQPESPFEMTTKALLKKREEKKKRE